MNTFIIKQILAWVSDALQINKLYLNHINKYYEKNYIRIVNYHGTKETDFINFEKQLKWYTKYFENVNMQDFESFMRGEKHFHNKPGIMLTFDDGMQDNYLSANKLMNQYGFTGYYFVSSELVGTDGYMTWEELKTLIEKGHIIGGHTATHHRMNEVDDSNCLDFEIIQSKKKLEKNLNIEIKMFAWCGGEEKHYTKKAAEWIHKGGYQYSFMTNSFPVTVNTDRFQLERINVEANWKMSLVRFQVCGWMDKKLKGKRERVEHLIS